MNGPREPEPKPGLALLGIGLLLLSVGLYLSV